MNRRGDSGRTFAISTLGCKVNQYDGEVIREGLIALGWREVSFRGRADVYIVNTCTVTSAADEKCRKVIRRAIRSNPAAKVIVTGCGAVVSPERYRSMPGVAAVLARDDVVRFATGVESDTHGVSRFAGRTRAFLKIQDGCDAACAYCIVPLARGRERSRPLHEIAGEAERLVASGHIEIVLAGVHLGHYGRDLASRPSLADAVEAVLSVRGVRRVRLSSIEATEVTDDILDIAASEERFCPHFHLPLQSGDDEVLRRMNRRYRVRQFLDVVERIRRRLEAPAITTDVMVGFPGEEDGHFRNTLRVCREAAFSRIHIFRYSPRPGTRAVSLPGSVPGHVVRGRERELKSLADELALAYHRSFLGRTVHPLIEHRRDRATGMLAGWSKRYMRVLTHGSDDMRGRILPVRVEEVRPRCVTGTALSQAAGMDDRRS